MLIHVCLVETSGHFVEKKLRFCIINTVLVNDFVSPYLYLFVSINRGQITRFLSVLHINAKPRETWSSGRGFHPLFVCRLILHLALVFGLELWHCHCATCGSAEWRTASRQAKVNITREQLQFISL